MIKSIVLGAFALAITMTTLQAQGVSFRFNNYDIHKKDHSNSVIQGAEVGYVHGLTKALDLYVPLRITPRGDVETVSSTGEKSLLQKVGTFALDAALQAKYDNGRNIIVPFLSGGFGLESYDSKVSWGAPIGGGLHFRLSDNIFATLASNYRLPISDAAPRGWGHSVGITFNLTDKDYSSSKTTKMVDFTPTPAPQPMPNKLVITEQVKQVLDYALKGVQFETGSDKLTKESYSVLDQVVTVLNDNVALKLSIEGHTDNTGGAALNQKLSENRAKSCMNYLVSKGIAATRLKVSGYGSTRPVADNSTPDGRTQNRRVEFIPF